MVRPIITTIDSLTALICHQLRIPPGARPVRLRRDPSTRLLALDLEADTPIFPAPTLALSFHLRRVFPSSEVRHD